MADQYGIPDNMFGDVPEELYRLVGRIMLTTTLVEETLLGLVQALDGSDQLKYAGQPGSTLVGHCRTAVEPFREPFRTNTLALLEQVAEALQMRHAIAHGLWADPRPDRVRLWRSARKNKRTDAHNAAVWFETNRDEMVALIKNLVDLWKRCSEATFSAALNKSG